jgi:acetylornithine deacetylase
VSCQDEALRKPQPLPSCFLYQTSYFQYTLLRIVPVAVFVFDAPFALHDDEKEGEGHRVGSRNLPMTDFAQLENKLFSYVNANCARLVSLICDLVRIPSENSPPNGAELDCQQYVGRFFHQLGWETDIYDLTDVPGLDRHHLFWPGRDYRQRPNVDARRKGTGGGRSLVLSGHIDTVPKGTQPWTRDPFGGVVEGNRIYGRGSNDMKAGIGTHLFVAESLDQLGLKLAGDLIIESVVDEEFGGVNGTLAGRLKGFNADAAVIAEPTFLKICPAQRGGRFVHITLNASGGILAEGHFPRGILDQLRFFLEGVEDFSSRRARQTKPHELYTQYADPVPVSITKIFTSPWGTTEPVTIPEICKIEMYWQLLPGEKRDQVDAEFFAWLNNLLQSRPDLFPTAPVLEFPVRWLPGSSISKSDPLVREFSSCAARALGQEPPVVGFEAPCDMYVFHQECGIPALLWGVRGGNTHAADEYVEIDSAVAAAKALLIFVCQWCGVSDWPERR